MRTSATTSRTRDSFLATAHAPTATPPTTSPHTPRTIYSGLWTGPRRLRTGSHGYRRKVQHLKELTSRDSRLVTPNSIRFNRAPDADFMTYAYLLSNKPREIRRGAPLSSSRVGRRSQCGHLWPLRVA